MIADLRDKLKRFLDCYLNQYLGEARTFNPDFDEVYFKPGLRAIEHLVRGEPIPGDLRHHIGDIVDILAEAYALLAVPEVIPEVRASRPMDDNRYIHATTEELHFPGSSEPMDYHLLTIDSKWVLIVATTGMGHAQRVLMMTAYRHPTGRVCIELPAGFMDPRDGNDPLVAGQRELLEETGYGQPTRTDILASNVTALDGVVRTQGAYVLLRGVSSIRSPQLEGHEEQSNLCVHLCRWDTVLALIEANIITSATTQAALLKAAQRLGVLVRR